MDFTFSEDQLLFQESVRDFLVNEVTPGKIRELWATDSGRSDELWAQLTELGLTGMTVPEEFGGLGMDELDFILLAQECGYVALPEPLVHTALVAVPLL
ncbi:MAG: acyl-CoA dehydrogenase family protein, partial [Gammaproteobacteria bacterium]|nr:acyl-CoA dehydrogenase family protein [Gammaproteobacteria bacterium]